MNQLLKYNYSEDKRVSNVDFGTIKGEFGSLEIGGYEVLFNYIRYLDRLGYVTRCAARDNNIKVHAETLPKREALTLIKESIYKLMDIAYLNNPRIQFYRYQLSMGYLNRIENYCDFLLNYSNKTSKKDRIFQDFDFLLFLSSCVVLNIQNPNDLLANINQIRSNFEAKKEA